MTEVATEMADLAVDGETKMSKKEANKLAKKATKKNTAVSCLSVLLETGSYHCSMYTNLHC